MLELVSFLFAIGVVFGTSCWIFGTLLNKSNNIGDSKGAKYEYNTNVNITSRSDRMSKSESETYIHYHAVKFDDSYEPKGTDLVRKLTDEEREEYKKMAAQTPPKGLYVSEKSRINTPLAHFVAPPLNIGPTALGSDVVFETRKRGIAKR